MQIVPVYAAILALLLVLLSVRTLLTRRRLKIAIGDSGDQQMLRAIRVHANFVEYVPMALLLLFLLETGGASTTIVHLLCGCLLLGRLSHAFGVSQQKENYRFRVFGMALTFTAILGSAMRLLWGAI